MITHYSQAWDEFTNLKTYHKIVEHFAQLGMKPPYIDNVIKSIFAAGYNSASTQTSTGKEDEK